MRPPRVKKRLVGLMMPVALNWTVRALSPSACRRYYVYGTIIETQSWPRGSTDCRARSTAARTAPRDPPRGVSATVVGCAARMIVDLPSFDVALEQQPATRVVTCGTSAAR